MEERYRERNSNLSVVGGSLLQKLVSGKIQIQKVGATTFLPFVEKMWDLVDPDYFEKKRTGQLMPVNPMTHEGKNLRVGSQAEDKTFSPSNWLCCYDYPSLGTLYGNQFWTDFTPFWNAAGTRAAMTAGIPGSCGEDPDVPSLAYMLQEARAKCHAAGAGMDMLTMLAELDKSVDLLKTVHTRTLGRARRVIDAATRIRKGDLNPQYRRLTRVAKLADLLSIASSLWLEYRFGWRLLVQDLEALQEVYARQDSFGRQLHRGTYQFTVDSTPVAVSTASNVRQVALENTTATLWGYYNYTSDRVVRRTVRVGVMEKFDNANPFFGDPFVTLWELMPLSWVGDVFANVGHAIMAWSPLVSGVPVHQWVSDEVTHINRRRMVPLVGTIYQNGSSRYYISAGESSVAEYGTRYYSRVPTTLQMPVISFKPDIGLTKVRKWMDVGAVVAGFGNKVVQMAAHSLKQNL